MKTNFFPSQILLINYVSVSSATDSSTFFMSSCGAKTLKPKCEQAAAATASHSENRDRSFAD